jgi:Cu+-exporting ATPase
VLETMTAETTTPPKRASTELGVTGMTCGNCARHVTEALQKVPGVQSAIVSLDAHQATVRWQPGTEPNVQALIEAVQEEGFGARIAQTHSHDHAQHQLSGWRLNLSVGLLGTLPLMLGEWVLGLALTPWFRWVSFGLAAIVQAVAGARFYRGAWGQLKVGSSNMDTLVALGSSTAFAYSTWALFSGHGGHLYFMEAAAIITLISVGHWMESRVSVRASSALRNLLNLAPAMAWRRNPDGTGTEVPVSELSSGNLVMMRPGDRVPTDAQVVEGNASVDESMLTGESIPVDKTPGSLVYAGTVNVDGRLVARVTATGEDTALSQIIVAVQRAQTSRANIQRLGDRVSNVFVPIVVVVALGAALWWGLAPGSANAVHSALAPFLWAAHPPATAAAAAFIIAAAVLIIACPCAMGLATPAAIMAGSNAAAERGILVRDGVALEKAGNVTCVLFDKTGTLTAGKPELVKVWVSRPGENDETLRRLAAGLARHSAHPVSQAIASVSTAPLELKDWEEVRGAGVKAALSAGGGDGTSDTHALLGSLRWLREAGVDTGPGKGFIEEWSAQGATITGLAGSGKLQALFAVKDTLKPGAQAVVQELQRNGFKTFMVTGDNPLTASSIAAQARIPGQNVFAEVRPEQKAEFVKRLQASGERVAFVGDGINDAPALEQADLGIAVSRASDIAREAADIILLNSEVEAIPESLGLARATLRTIKQNLFWAFFYNAVGIPLAAMGFMSPILCAAAMGLSDLVVIGNAMRLRRWKRQAFPALRKSSVPAAPHRPEEVPAVDTHPGHAPG